MKTPIEISCDERARLLGWADFVELEARHPTSANTVKAEARAEHRALEEAGYLILSKEPTEEMIDFAYDEDEPGMWRDDIRRVVVDALSAAPRWSDQ